MSKRVLSLTAVAVWLVLCQSAWAAGDRLGPSASVFAQRPALMHGIAADGRVVWVTEPGIEAPGRPRARVMALAERTGREIGELPPPPGGFRLPFALRVTKPGRLVVLDNAGFPPQGPPAVYEYRYHADRRVRAQLKRTIGFGGLPLLFAEDIEVLPGGQYVVSESVIGALWLVGRDGKVSAALGPSDRPLPKLAGCPLSSGPLTVGGLPFAPIGGFAPGVGSLAVRGSHLYFGSSCLGGLHRLSLATLRDSRRPAEERAREIETVSPRPPGTPLESLKGLVWNPRDPNDPWIYTGDPFRLRFLRIHSVTGRREILGRDPRLFNFSVATTFARARSRRGRATLLVASDQEYRWVGLNGALTRSAFQRPFVITRVRVPPQGLDEQ